MDNVCLPVQHFSSSESAVGLSSWLHAPVVIKLPVYRAAHILVSQSEMQLITCCHRDHVSRLTFRRRLSNVNCAQKPRCSAKREHSLASESLVCQTRDNGLELCPLLYAPLRIVLPLFRLLTKLHTFFSPFTKTAIPWPKDIKPSGKIDNVSHMHIFLQHTVNGIAS